MLVLSGKVGDRVVINHGTPQETVLTVVDVCRGKVRLGFAAPPDVVIHRQSVIDRMLEQKDNGSGE